MKRNKDHSSSTRKKRQKEKVLNDLFLSSIVGEDQVKEVLEKHKGKNGQKQSLQESLQVLNRMANTMPSSPTRINEPRFSSFLDKQELIDQL